MVGLLGLMSRSVSLAGVIVTVLLVGCGSRVINHAPVEDRGTSVGKPAPAVSAPVDAQGQPGKPLPGLENAGKPGYYTVKPGDTLIKIGLETGQNWKDIARWSGLDNANQVEVGQVLRIIPPVAIAPPAGVAVAKPVTTTTVNAATVPSAVPASGPKPAVSAPAAVAVLPPTPAPVAPAAVAPQDEINWIWPTNGVVLAGFDEVKNKGLDLGGKAGDPVVAAADGRVVYVGAGLRGYGNLIILKHNNTYLTAYAHNQTLLVKEDQSVRQGQKIAEMGNSDSDRVKLHFEVRRQGKPVDPAKHLPPR
ncbi:MAG TPA: peptidoglycan DD-metalloendopeptidase family protein [Burkholderiaceae bacterium]|nr:peptidoglycan DD-metalloendopeptidase family protein [Burkholderiaceae bacterium]